MIIYIDIIIIINILIDALVLIFTGTLLKRKISYLKILIASIIGIIPLITTIYIDSIIINLLIKIIISIIMITVSFNYNNFEYFKNNLVFLYINSILLGGLVNLTKNQITFNNEIIQNRYIYVIILLLISSSIFIKIIKKEKQVSNEISNYYHIDIYYLDNIISGIGFLDTGNDLKDPYFHKPIILVNEELIKDKVKTFLVPYYTVNHYDLLRVFKPQKIIIENKHKAKALIGLSNVNYNGIKIILNKEII